MEILKKENFWGLIYKNCLYNDLTNTKSLNLGFQFNDNNELELSNNYFDFYNEFIVYKNLLIHVDSIKKANIYEYKYNQKIIYRDEKYLLFYIPDNNGRFIEQKVLLINDFPGTIHYQINNNFVHFEIENITKFHFNVKKGNENDQEETSNIENKFSKITQIESLTLSSSVSQSNKDTEILNTQTTANVICNQTSKNLESSNNIETPSNATKASDDRKIEIARKKALLLQKMKLGK